MEPLVQSLPKLSIKGAKNSRVLEVKGIETRSIQIDSSDDDARKSNEPSPLVPCPLEVLAATSLLNLAQVLDESHDSPLSLGMDAFSIEHPSFDDFVTITPALPKSSTAPTLEIQRDQYDLEYF